MLEGPYKTKLRKEIERRFPGCIVLKNDASYRQGMPDMLILYRDRWAILEVKKAKPKPSDFEPNQEYYIDLLNQMSFSACIYPSNEEEVLSDLQVAFES